MDDEESVHDIVGNKLADQRVRHAYNLHQAELSLAERAADVILLDLNLPDGCGIDLVPHVPAGSAVVVCTAYPSLETARRALACGAADYLYKSSETYAELPRIVTRAARRARALALAENLEALLALAEETDTPHRPKLLDDLHLLFDHVVIERAVATWGSNSSAAGRLGIVHSTFYARRKRAANAAERLHEILRRHRDRDPRK